MLFIAISSLFLSPASAAENKGPVLVKDTSLEGQYVEALKSGDTIKAEQLSKHKDFDVDALNSRFLFGGKTLLMWAIKGDVNAPVLVKDTSLEGQYVEALKSGDTIKAEQLSKHKDFDVDALNSRFLFGGKTLLMWAIEGDVNAPVLVKDTSLEGQYVEALKSGDTIKAKQLSEHEDFDVDALNSRFLFGGKTLLMWAIEGDVNAPVSVTARSLEQQFIEALKSGDTNKAKQLSEHEDFDVDALNSRFLFGGKTLLMWATKGNDVDVAKLLSERKDIDVKANKCIFLLNGPP